MSRDPIRSSPAGQHVQNLMANGPALIQVAACRTVYVNSDQHAGPLPVPWGPRHLHLQVRALLSSSEACETQHIACRAAPCSSMCSSCSLWLVMQQLQGT